MKGIAVCLSLLLAAGPAFAAPVAPKPVSSKKMEASMVLGGQIEVDEQGLVRGYTLDKSEKLTAKLREFVDANIQRWRFEPTLVEGKPMAVRNRMGLQLILATQDDGNFRIELRATNFYREKVDKDLADAEVVRVSMKPPMYPRQAADAGVEAEVYLALRIGRDGSVVDVAVEQVNMKSLASMDDSSRWRRVFAANAAARAREWTFRPPSRGEDADNESWTVRVPVNYMLGREEEYGVWVPYYPGVRQPVPWLAGTELGSPEALADGGVYPVGDVPGRLRLVTPAKADG
ncbi:MAG: energy transducer TonB [Pseudoxanthomonas sp.]|nr:energy transducer TonB [Pseudoxanthomonas sp.]